MLPFPISVGRATDRWARRTFSPLQTPALSVQGRLVFQLASPKLCTLVQDFSCYTRQLCCGREISTGVVFDAPVPDLRGPRHR